jgi:heme oxygenase
MSRLLDRLAEETRALHKEAEADGDALLEEINVVTYRRFLSRWYGFVAPVERSLADVNGLDRVLDSRRLRKRLLLEHDLQSLGMKHAEIQMLPQCMAVPLFDSVRDALGWAFVIERSTLSHPNLFRRLATSMPGEVAFGSSYLKCYFGSVGEMWRSFGDGVEMGGQTQDDADRIVESAKTAYRVFRRWRNTLDGKALSIVGTMDAPSSSRGST